MMRSAFLVAAASALTFRIASATSVFAHFMVQNAYAYDLDQWKKDISSAQQIGIDGFALNWIPPNCQGDLSWTIDTIDDAFNAASQMGFSMIHSFDMSYSECNVYWNQTFMADIISKNKDSSANYKWNNGILVTTYGGDQVDEYGNDFFQGLKDQMSSSCPITLAPALTTYSMGAQTNPQQYASSLVSDYPSIDGYVNWQAWALNVKQNQTVTADQAFQSQLKSSGKPGPYIMSESTQGMLCSKSC